MEVLSPSGFIFLSVHEVAAYALFNQFFFGSRIIYVGETMRPMPLIFLLLAIFYTFPAHAQEVRISVVVNEDAITNQDIDDRLGLIFMSSGLPPDPAIKAQVRERVIRNLIDEKLQLQEAKRNGIEAPQEEVDKAFEYVAKQNGISTDALKEMMQKNNVPRETLIHQIRAALSWTKLIQRTLRPQVEVGDDEVNAVLERVKANEGKTEYLLSEIFLAAENPADEAKIAQLADNLIERMKQGARFSAIAQQFSQGASAINGGDLGWIQPGQLPPELDAAAKALQPGSISRPLHMTDGFHIIGKREERVVTSVPQEAVKVRLKQASTKLSRQSIEQAADDIQKFRNAISSCSALTSRLEHFPGWTQADLGEKRMGELPPWLAAIAQKAQIGVPSEPMEQNGYAILLYVCSRNDSGADHDAVLAMLGNEKLELQARRLLRDLHRQASIEMRS